MLHISSSGIDDVGMDRDAVVARGACEAGTVEPHVDISTEDRLAIVTAPAGVQRQLWDENRGRRDMRGSVWHGRAPRDHRKSSRARA